MLEVDHAVAWVIQGNYIFFNRGFARQPCCMAGTMKIFCIRKNFFSHRKKNLLFLPCNMAAVQNLYWRALASFQALSEVSALVHLRVPRVSGKVRVIERGVWCWSASKVSLHLWSLSFPGSLSPRPQEWETDPQNEVEGFAAHTCVPQTWTCLQARKENTLFHSNFFLRDHFLYPNDVANGFCLKWSILK